MIFRKASVADVSAVEEIYNDIHSGGLRPRPVGTRIAPGASVRSPHPGGLPGRLEKRLRQHRVHGAAGPGQREHGAAGEVFGIGRAVKECR